MIDAGKLHITLKCNGEKVETVEMESTRPLHTSRLFIGKTPEQTLQILPLLFNVCGVAQSFAAVTACSQALGITENSAITAARQLLLNIEIIREHCWWLLINTDKARLAPFLKYVNDFKKALFVDGNAFSLDSQLEIKHEQLDSLLTEIETDLDALFGNQRQRFLDTKNEVDLNLWLENNASIPADLLRNLLANNQQSLGRSVLRLLPNLVNADLLTNFDSQTPKWQDECHETSCLNRQQKQPLIVNLLEHYGNSLITRLVSRFLELAAMPNVLRQNEVNVKTPFLTNFNQIEKTAGISQIQASRGLLIHKVELKDGVIAHYQIVAPTEWNFQLNGVAALSLQSLSVHNETLLRQQAALIINAIDPCVGFELVID